MPRAASSSFIARATPDRQSLDASDEFDGLAHAPRYCPPGLLATFTMLMAGHGRCVNSAMMLGDREYAIWQLARAHTLGDAELREVSARLFVFFDDPRSPAPVGFPHN